MEILLSANTLAILMLAHGLCSPQKSKIIILYPPVIITIPIIRLSLSLPYARNKPIKTYKNEWVDKHEDNNNCDERIDGRKKRNQKTLVRLRGTTINVVVRNRWLFPKTDYAIEPTIEEEKKRKIFMSIPNNSGRRRFNIAINIITITFNTI